MLVLAAINGSDVSPEVVRWAGALAERVAADVRVLHVGVPRAEVADLVDAEGERLEQREGEVVGTLLAELEQADVLMGVMGTRDATTGPVPAGSTSLAVLRQVRKPVLLVPPVRAGTRGVVRLERVSVPLDGTEEVATALREVLRTLVHGGTDVVVVHAFDRPGTPAFWDRPGRDSRLWASEFLARYCDETGARAVLVAGEPGASVLTTGEAEHADAVLLAWRQDDSPGRARTLKGILSEATVPVLVVPVPSPGPPL